MACASAVILVLSDTPPASDAGVFAVGDGALAAPPVLTAVLLPASASLELRAGLGSAFRAQCAKLALSRETPSALAHRCRCRRAVIF